MTPEEWETKAAKLAVRDGTLENPTLPSARSAMIELHNLFLEAPTQIQQRYKSIAEDELRTISRQAINNIDDGSHAWLALEDQVRASAAQVRALDIFVLDHRQERGVLQDRVTSFLCPHNRCHAIPRPNAKPPTAEKLRTPTYRRRGLVWHRVIPEIAKDGCRIELRWFADLSLSFRRPGATALAALFEDLHLTRKEGFAKFVASQAPCADEERTIVEQVEASFAPDVALAVWPELTMPPDRRNLLKAALRARSAAAAPGHGPNFVAAGSWHEVDADGVHNRMAVLSRSGLPKFHYDKSVPLKSRTLGDEELTPSYVVPILIADDALITFAICRDFCEQQISQVYRQLDVDLVIVPSYGDDATILSHRDQAVQLAGDGGACAFVVQQRHLEADQGAPLGYILPPVEKPNVLELADMAMCSPISKHGLFWKKV